MQIRKGSQTINKGTQQAIIEFVFDEYVIFVFHGKLSQYDILIKYRKDGTRIRTPQHIHWAVDILMKMQGNEDLAKEYLTAIQNCWNTCKPLRDSSYETLKALIEDGENNINIDKYKSLDDYGEYSVEFLYVLMELLAVQEKTNRPDAYMFGNIISELLEADRDLFKIMSTAGFGGRR